jgi:hypothetical protein
MKSVAISQSDFRIIQTSYHDLYLRKISISWDGRGGLIFEFDPPLLEIIVKEKMIEILSDLMTELDMSWDIEIEFNYVYEKEIEFSFVEVRNLGEYEDDLDDQIRVNSPALCQQVAETYQIDLDETEYQISFSIDGSSNGDYSLSYFSICAFTDDGDIEIDDEVTQELAGRELHSLILGLGPNESGFDYECSMDGQSPELTIRLDPSSFKLTIAQ